VIWCGGVYLYPPDMQTGLTGQINGNGRNRCAISLPSN